VTSITYKSRKESSPCQRAVLDQPRKGSIRPLADLPDQSRYEGMRRAEVPLNWPLAIKIGWRPSSPFLFGEDLCAIPERRLDACQRQWQGDDADGSRGAFASQPPVITDGAGACLEIIMPAIRVVVGVEDALDLCAEEPDRKAPGSLFRRKANPVIGEVRQPIKLKPGQLERRISTAELFIFLDVHSHRPPYRHRCLHAETRGRSLSKAERVRVVLALMRAQQSGRPDPSATSERD
jgi:hypothetical protein